MLPLSTIYKCQNKVQSRRWHNAIYALDFKGVYCRNDIIFFNGNDSNWIPDIYSTETKLCSNRMFFGQVITLRNAFNRMHVDTIRTPWLCAPSCSAKCRLLIALTLPDMLSGLPNSLDWIQALLWTWYIEHAAKVSWWRWTNWLAQKTSVYQKMSIHATLLNSEISDC